MPEQGGEEERRRGGEEERRRGGEEERAPCHVTHDPPLQLVSRGDWEGKLRCAFDFN